MPKPSHLAVLGVGKEATDGTAVAATMWVPWKTLTPKDEVTLIEDTNQRGAPVASYGRQPGPKGSTLDVGGEVFADSIGFLLASVLPDVVVTGTAAPYATAFSTLCTGDTQPPSQTWTIFDPLGTWQYPGQKCSELSFKWNADGYLTWAAKLAGWTYVAGTTPTPSWASTPKPQPNWAIACKLAGTQVFTQDGEITIKRPVAAIRGANGTQNPYSMWSGDVSVEGKLTLVMEDTSQRSNFQSGTAQSLDLSYLTGTGATQTGLDLHGTLATFTEGTPAYGKDYIELPVSFACDANATDTGASGGWSPLKATLTNAMPSGTYK